MLAASVLNFVHNERVRSLQGKSVLITGAGRGIGKRLAIGFAAAGASVGLLGRSQAELDLAKLEIEHAGGVAVRVRADVRDYQQTLAAAKLMRAMFGNLHVVVAAAAVLGPVGPLTECVPADWKDAVDTNFYGLLHTVRAVLPRMIEQREGKVIVLTCLGSNEPRPNLALFAASKAAAVRFVESVAEEVREYNVQVNSMEPGATYSNMTDEILEASRRAGEREVQDAERLRRGGGISVEKQIKLALFLASQDSNHISGKTISVSDDWKKLERESMRPDAFTLRRHVHSKA